MTLGLRRLGAAATLFLVAAGPASAVDPAAIKQDIDAIIGHWRRLAQSDPGVQIRGDAVVREQAGEVVATLPEVQVQGPDGSFALRPVTLRIKDAGPDTMDVRVELPPRFDVLGPDGKPQVSLVLGSQNLVGVWRKSIRTFETADMTVDKLSLIDPGQKPLAEIARLSFTGGVKESAPGVWSGAYKFAIEGTKVAAPDGTSVAVGSVFYDFILKDARLAELAPLMDNAGLGLTGATVWNPEGLTLPQWQTLLAAVERMPGLVGGISIVYGATDIHVASPMMGPEPLLRADGAAFGFGVAGDGARGTSLSIGLDVKRVRGPSSLPFEVPTAAIPHSFDLRLELDQLPTGAVWEAFFGATRQNLERPPGNRPGARALSPPEIVERAFQAAVAMTAPRAMETFSQARPQLHIRNLAIAFPEGRIDAVGTVRFAPEAPQMATGTIELKLSGIDDLIEKLGRNPKSDQEAIGVIGLTFLRGLGKPTPGPGGKPIYVVQIQVADDGRVLANGIDAMKMFELLEKRRR
ncbi:MAG: hypothetical protein AB7O45_07325 [Alphaproteobacteria bacterium]